MMLVLLEKMPLEVAQLRMCSDCNEDEEENHVCM